MTHKNSISSSSTRLLDCLAGRVKQADGVPNAALEAMQSQNHAMLGQEAMNNVGTLGLTALGVGAAARGAVGLYHILRNNFGKPKRTRSGPALLSLPYPVAKEALDLDTNVTRVGGLPWYGPAMMATGLAGLGVGWKGVDMVLKRRAKKDREAQLAAARQQFHDSLVSQYDKPYAATGPFGKAAADKTHRSELGYQLDRLYNAVTEKVATFGDEMGQLAGGYGMAGGTLAFLTGAIVYDKMKKRQQRAILEKALQKRERRRFAQQPTEITAVPEPFHQPVFNPRAELKLLRQPPVDPEPITSLD
jgi:hypothetical protein